MRIAAVVGLGLVAALSIALAAAASTTKSSSARPSVTVSAAVHHDVSQPLRDIKPTRVSHQRRLRREQELPPRPSIGGVDTVVQADLGGGLMPAPSANFEGVGTGLPGALVNSAPPDTNGDVGPNHYVQTVNTQFAIFSKTGAVLLSPRNINTLWSGFGGGCQSNNDGDPTVIYDPIADRWVISQFSVSTTPYLQCVAVSTGPDPTGSYYRYAFSYGTVDFPDYPKIGVWPDAYYTTYNIFANGRTFAGAKVCAFDRASMLTGAAATQQCFNTSTSYGGLLASDLDGATLPPAGAPNYVVGLGATSGLAYWKFHVDWANSAGSTFTGPTALATAAYSEACGGGACIPQAGTTQRLDSLADRVMNRLAYRNFGDHESLVVNHSVTAGSSSGVRWYELRVGAGNSLDVFQQGTYAPDSSYRWMGSIATDRAGNMGLGFSVSSSSLNPQIHYTGRLAGDPLGQMPQGEGTIINGTGSQNGGLSRWGDYSSMSVDPVDDCTFWFTTEYLSANGSFNWRTRVGSFTFPGCGSAPPPPPPPVPPPPPPVPPPPPPVPPPPPPVPPPPPPVPPPPPPGVVQNGDFETGSLPPWSASGLVSPVITSPGHTGTYAARLGSSSAFNGNSTLTQTVTLPAGMPTLTFWYSPSCPDTLTYDQIQMQIRRTSGKRLATVLNVCSNTGAWTQQTYNIPSNIAGRTVVLWFNVHDDGNPIDPTSALIDDVAVN